MKFEVSKKTIIITIIHDDASYEELELTFDEATDLVNKLNEAIGMTYLDKITFGSSSSPYPGLVTPYIGPTSCINNSGT